MRTAAVAILVLLALAFPASSSPAGSFPAFYEIGNSQDLARNVDVDFDFEDLDSAGETERIVVTIPPEYGVDLAHAPGKNIGSAYLATLPVGGGGETEYRGSLVAESATTDVQACAPGAHAAVWALHVTSKAGATLDVPMAIDHGPAGYTLTACFDAEHGQGLEVSFFQFFPMGTIATPSQPGKYLFDATVTPFASDGTPSTSTTYELRAYEILPESLTAAATFDSRRKMLTVSGKLTIQRAGAGAKQVEIDAGPTTNSFKKIGIATTRANGTYLFEQRVSVAPKYVYALTEANAFGVCSGSSPEPGGCASYSIDGTASTAQRPTR